MSANVLEVISGATLSRVITLLDENNQPVTTYSADAALVCEAWSGDNQDTAFVLGSQWLDPASGTLIVSATAAQTTAWPNTFYRLLLTITEADIVKKGLVGFLRIQPAPVDRTAAIPVYCTFDDVLRYAPWIMDLVTTDPSMQSDLAEQRGRARSWLDEVILQRDRPNDRYLWGVSPTSPYFSPRWGYGLYGDIIGNPWLRDQLAADKLIVRPQVVELTAKKTIAYVCEPQLGKAGGEDGTPYQTLARRYHASAGALLSGLVAEIDLSNPKDGIADYWVRCGVISAR